MSVELAESSKKLLLNIYDMSMLKTNIHYEVY